jgi:undecaprenyl-diphosphatase
MTAVGLDSAAGFVVHAVALVAFSGLASTSQQPFTIHGPDLPDQWEFLLLVAVVLPGLGIAMHIARLGRRLRSAIRRAADDVLALARDPRRGARLLAASAGVTAAYAFALWAAVRAAGGAPSLVAVVVVYLGGSALAAAAPTPGGLGAIEAGLIAGLTSAGQPAPAAVTAVLVFRLVTFWLPVVPGALSFWALRRSGAL